MQKKFHNETACFKSNRYVRRIEKTCFKIAVILFLVTFLSYSCSLLSSSNQNEIKDLKQSFDAICLSGEGSGRMEYFTQKYNFSFESRLSFEEETWSLGVIMPFYGDEIIKLDFADIDNGRYRIVGDFAARLKRINNKYYKRLLRLFLIKYSKFLKFYKRTKELVDKNCSVRKLNGTCKYQGEEINYSRTNNKFAITFKKSSKYTFTMVFSEFDGKFYKRTKLYLKNQNEGGHKRVPIKFDMISTICD